MAGGAIDRGWSGPGWRGTRRLDSSTTRMGPYTASHASLAGYVGLVTSHLPSELASARDLAAIRAAIGELPAELVSDFGFRLRLDSAEPATGLRLRADDETGGLQMLSGRHQRISLPPPLAGADDWQAIIRFCEERKPGFLLHRSTDSVWIELCAEAGATLWFNLRPTGRAEPGRAPQDALVRVLELGTVALHGQPRAGWARATLRTFLRRLPAGAEVVRGGGTSDHREEARLWIAGLAAAEIVALVRAGRDEREAARLAAVLEDIGAAGSLEVRVDVGVALGPAIAVSCSVDPAGDEASVADRWAAVLRALGERGLCTAAKRDALLGCRGTLRDSTSAGWPQHLQRLAPILGEGMESTISWRPESVEILCDRGEPLTAHAYVGVSHAWSPRS